MKFVAGGYAAPAVSINPTHISPFLIQLPYRKPK